MTGKLLVAFSIACMSVAATARTVVVGIAESCFTNEFVGVGCEYAEAVYAAGAVPYVLPATTNQLAIAAMLDRVDVLLLTGGGDVAAERYGADAGGKLGRVDLRRDAWEFAVLDEAVRRRMPVLGICRGCQLLNVRFGGTLWRDLPSEKPGAREHRLKGEHHVAIEKGAYLERLVGGVSVSVNSRHHQAVREVAPGFKATAVSDDDVVEAVEGVGYPAIGVQFHPESLFVRNGRREFLPLYRGEFAMVKKEERPGSKTFKTVAIPDYCATNRMVVAKQNMVGALETAGFVSVVVPFTQDDKLLEEAMAGADALMVAGGIGLLQDYPRRCEFEHRAIRLALKRGIPIAGVCHGSHVINTYFGGKLRLTPQKNGEKDFLIAHRMPGRTPYTDNFHLADLEPGSRIWRVLGSNRVVVNSSHGNRSFDMGTGLRITARAQDGVIEAFEHESLPVMAFQFHPERMVYDHRFVELLKESLSR